MNAPERRIRSYEEMGDHRTGRDADNAATAWMVDELASVGVHAEPQEWTFPQVDWDDASVRINGTSVPGVPLFDGALTSVSGNLAEPGSSGIVVSAIAHGDGTQFSQAMYRHLTELREGGAAAVVLVMGDPDGNHAIRNAERPLDPLDLAVLQVAPNDAAPLLEGAANAQAAQLSIEGWRKTKTAANVVATVPGTDPAAAPVTLMTPKSGWFTCAAERGGGIAIWMEVAGRVAAEPGRRSLNIVASSGHELHHLGLEHYIRSWDKTPPTSTFGCTWEPRSAPATANPPTPLPTTNSSTSPPARSPTFSWNAVPSRSATPASARQETSERSAAASSRSSAATPTSTAPPTPTTAASTRLARKHTDAVEQIIRYMLA